MFSMHWHSSRKSSFNFHGKFRYPHGSGLMRRLVIVSEVLPVIGYQARFLAVIQALISELFMPCSLTYKMSSGPMCLSSVVQSVLNIQLKPWLRQQWSCGKRSNWVVRENESTSLQSGAVETLIGDMAQSMSERLELSSFPFFKGVLGMPLPSV